MKKSTKLQALRVVWVFIVLNFVSFVGGTLFLMIKSSFRPTTDSKAVVTMEQIAYRPRALAVRKGTQVIFDNADVVPHTVTADDGTFDSGILNPGEAFRLVASTSVAYHCEVHPTMRSTISISG